MQLEMIAGASWARDCKVTAAYGLSNASLKGLFMCRDSRGGAEGGG